MPVISGRWEEDKYKAVCNRTATRPVHVLHVPSEGKVASMCVLCFRPRPEFLRHYEMHERMTCILRPSRQYFSHIGTMGG